MSLLLSIQLKQRITYWLYLCNIGGVYYMRVLSILEIEIGLSLDNYL